MGDAKTSSVDDMFRLHTRPRTQPQPSLQMSDSWFADCTRLGKSLLCVQKNMSSSWLNNVLKSVAHFKGAVYAILDFWQALDFLFLFRHSEMSSVERNPAFGSFYAIDLPLLLAPPTRYGTRRKRAREQCFASMRSRALGSLHLTAFKSFSTAGTRSKCLLLTRSRACYCASPLAEVQFARQDQIRNRNPRQARPG